MHTIPSPSVAPSEAVLAELFCKHTHARRTHAHSAYADGNPYWWHRRSTVVSRWLCSDGAQPWKAGSFAIAHHALELGEIVLAQCRWCSVHLNNFPIDEREPRWEVHPRLTIEYAVSGWVFARLGGF